MSAGINGLRAGGDYLAIPAPETHRCASPYDCREPVPFVDEFCDACRDRATYETEDEARHAEPHDFQPSVYVRRR